MVLHLYNKCKYYLDYFPLILLTLFFLSETDIEQHALRTSYQISITIVTLSIFYIISLRLKNINIAFALSIIVWILLIYIKKNYIN